MSFLDRTNIGNAKITGLQKDLKMTNNQYNAALTVFFVSYSVFEPMSNILLKRLRPRIFIPAMYVPDHPFSVLPDRSPGGTCSLAHYLA